MTAWTPNEALNFAITVMRLPGADRPATRRLASAYVELSAQAAKLRLLEHDRMILKTLAWDREANRIWPETCRVIQEWIDKTEAK